ncbi:MAG: efflux RND transporter periplasmic adaptor subunit [Planctomycetales bacterium]|nr:efflux RND transporter periplasmic adaptor subunit [Planctomycetales bacterium]
MKLSLASSTLFQRFIVLLAGSALLGVSGCARPAPAVTKAAPPKVTVDKPAVKTVTDYDEFTGRLAAVDSVDVRARVSGYLEKIAFEPGVEVKEGDLLFEIDARPYQAELDRGAAAVESAQATLKRTDADLARAKELFDKKIIAREEYDLKIATQGEAAAAVKSAQAALEKSQLDLGFTKVISPLSGRTSRNQLSIGNLISATTPSVLTTIVSINPMHVYFDADERALLTFQQRARAGGRDPVAFGKTLKTAQIPVEVAVVTDEGFPHKGFLDFAENRVDASTGTIQVRGELPNEDRVLTPGLFVRVRVPAGESYQAVLVPERAIGTEQGRKFVFVVDDSKVAHQRTVKLGKLIDGLRVVTEGVKADDQIITNGLQRARDKSPVDPQK